MNYISSNPNLMGTATASANIDQARERISSGQKINSASDDAAGMIIAQGLSTQSTAMSGAQKNIGDSASLLQTRSGALNSVTSGISRMQELSVQSQNGILNDSDREALNKEFQAIKAEITNITENSNFNGQSLFSDESSTVQSGTNAGDLTELSSNNLGQALKDIDFDSLTINSGESANAVLSGLSELQDDVSEFQALTGADLNRLDSQNAQLGQSIINTESSRSKIQDADLAKEISILAQEVVKNEVNNALQVQANGNHKNVLALLSL